MTTQTTDGIYQPLPDDLPVNVDTRLHAYWTECNLFRRDQALTQDQFGWCMLANCGQPDLPPSVWQKIRKFSAVAV